MSHAVHPPSEPVDIPIHRFETARAFLEGLLEVGRAVRAGMPQEVKAGKFGHNRVLYRGVPDSLYGLLPGAWRSVDRILHARSRMSEKHSTLIAEFEKTAVRHLAEAIAGRLPLAES